MKINGYLALQSSSDTWDVFPNADAKAGERIAQIFRDRSSGHWDYYWTTGTVHGGGLSNYLKDCLLDFISHWNSSKKDS